MDDRVMLKFARPVLHDNVHYEAGEFADVQRDMAQTLIACGAAVIPTPSPRPSPTRGEGEESESAATATSPEQEFDAGKMQRDALVAAAIAGLMKAGDPASFSKQTGKLKIPAVEAHLASLGHNIQVSGAERDALQAKYAAPPSLRNPPSPSAMGDKRKATAWQEEPSGEQP